MCYLCEQQGMAGKHYQATQRLCKALKHDFLCHETAGAGGADKRCAAFDQPDRTTKPPSLEQQRRTLFRRANGWPYVTFGAVRRCPATLPLPLTQPVTEEPEVDTQTPYSDTPGVAACSVSLGAEHA